MALSGAKTKILRNALVDAFDKSALSMMVKVQLDRRLDEIAHGGSLEEIAFELIEWADMNDRLPDLIAGAYEERKRDNTLREIVEQMPGWLSDTPQHPPPSRRAPPTRQPVAHQPREIAYDVFLAFSSVDSDIATRVSGLLNERAFSTLLAEGMLRPEQAADYEDVESRIRQCHVAVVLVSQAILDRWQEQPDHTARLLNLLRARTGEVIALCRTAGSLESAKDLGLSQVIDISGWDPEAPGIAPAWLDTLESILEKRVPASGTRTIGLPFVIVTMNGPEAQELENSVASMDEGHDTDAEDNPSVRKARTALRGLTAISDRYGPRRDDWKPFVNSKRTIIEVVNDVVERVNKRAMTDLAGRRIKVHYYPLDPLITNDNYLRGIYNEIAKVGCVVVLDEISLFHETVLDALQKSPLYSSDAIAWVTISPLNPYGQPPFSEIEQELKDGLRDAFWRFDSKYDPQCELGVMDERRLTRWLHVSLPQAVRSLRSPGPNLDRIANFGEEVFGDHYRTTDEASRAANALFSEPGVL